MFNGLTLKNDDDGLDDFFSDIAATGTSNLTGVFGDSFAPSNNLNKKTNVKLDDSLKYIPPKSSKSAQPGEKSNWSVVIAKVVNAFKLINGENVAQGKLGLALLQKSEENIWKLIIYRTKEQILSTAVLTSANNVYYKQQYLQYQDDANIFWSLNFDLKSDCDEFLCQLEDKCAVDRPLKNSNDKNSNISDELSSHPSLSNIDSVIHKTNDALSKRSGQKLPKIDEIHDNVDFSHQFDESRFPNSFKRCTSPKGADNSFILTATPNLLHSKPTNISVSVQPAMGWPLNNNNSLVNLYDAVTENRAQNTEVQMNLSKMATKIDQVLDKMEYLKINTDNTVGMDDEIIKLEEKLIVLRKENRCLKLKINDLEISHKVKLAATDAIKVEKCRDCIEGQKRSSILLRDNIINDSLLDIDRNLCVEKSDSCWQLETKIKDLEAKLQEENIKRTKLEQENKNLIANDLVRSRDLETALKIKNTKIAELEQSLSQADAKNHTTVRAIMNELYVKLYQNVSEKETMTSGEILKLTAEIIRSETKSALN